MGRGFIGNIVLRVVVCSKEGCLDVGNFRDLGKGRNYLVIFRGIRFWVLWIKF